LKELDNPGRNEDETMRNFEPILGVLILAFGLLLVPVLAVQVADPPAAPVLTFPEK